MTPRIAVGLALGGGCTGAIAVAAALLAACGGGAAPPVSAVPPARVDARLWPANDGSLCERFVHWKRNPALEVSETAGPGAPKANIRRVFKVTGERDNRHSVLVCREIDTNLDGVKDVVRIFDEKGQPLHEEADTNFDGKIDHWVNFAGGRIEEEDVDATLSMGRPNVWKFYVDGELSRVRRNTHCPSGRADTWEIYYKNRLERVGNDTSCDGHIDRWDRDAQLMVQEEAQGVEIADGGANQPVTVGPNGEVSAADAAVASSNTDGGRAHRPSR